MHIYKKLTLATAVLSTFATLAIAQTVPDLSAKIIRLSFEGEIVNATCNIVIENGILPKNVKLKTIGVASLMATDNIKLDKQGTEFTVSATACPLGRTTVQAKFTKAGTLGVLDNTGDAKNVGILLSQKKLGSNFEPINGNYFDLAGTPNLIANQQDFAISLRAAYYKKDSLTITAGKVTALAELEVSYK